LLRALARVKGACAADLHLFAKEVHSALAKQDPLADRTDGPFALFAATPTPESRPRPLSAVQRARLFVGGNIARLTTAGYAVVAGLAVSVALVAVGGWWFHSGRVTTSAFERDTITPFVEELNPVRPQQ
jgi:hypothetical protein